MSLLFWLSAFAIALAYVFCLVRMALGPSLADRIVALDLLANLLMASIALFSIYKKQAIFLDIVVALALVMFLSSTMYARYLEKMLKEKEKRDDTI